MFRLRVFWPGRGGWSVRRPRELGFKIESQTRNVWRGSQHARILLSEMGGAAVRSRTVEVQVETMGRRLLV